MAIEQVTVNDANAVTKINQSIDRANEVPSKADASALASEVADRQQAIVALPLADIVHTRPGEAINYVTSSIGGGDPALLAAVDSSKIRSDDAGYVIRQAGDGIVASRMLYAVEPGRKYLDEYAVQRRVNSPDPDNDAIKCAIAWYDQSRNYIGQTTVQNLLGVTTGSGRLTVQAVVSRAAADDVTVVSPANARYCRPFVQTYGTLVQNDIEVIRWTDITSVNAFSPDLTSLEGRMSTQESIDAGDRITALETAVTAPTVSRFATRSDAIAATIPVSSDSVEVFAFSGSDTPIKMTFTRVAGLTPGGFQSVDGAYWQLNETSPVVQMFDGDPIALEAYRALAPAWLSDDFSALAARGKTGTSALQSLQGSELRAAAGMADNRIYLGTAASTYIVNPEDHFPAIHMGEPTAGVTMQLDVSSLRTGQAYVFTNEGTIGNGTNGGIIEFDCGAQNHFRGDIGVIPNTVTVTSIKIYPGETVWLIKTGGNRIHVLRQSVQSYWAATADGSSGTYKWRRWADGSIEAVYTRTAQISASATATLNLPASFKLDNATLLSCNAGPKSDGAVPTDMAPFVGKIGTVNGLSQNQFSLTNRSTSAWAWPVTVHFIGITE